MWEEMFLEIKNLKKSFGTQANWTEVLKGIDFAVEKGEICVLLGPSGSGKSTLLNISQTIEAVRFSLPAAALPCR